MVDPSEEKLKAQLMVLIRSYVPLHAMCIDEVERLGVARISEAAKVWMSFPMPVPPVSKKS